MDRLPQAMAPRALAVVVVAVVGGCIQGVVVGTLVVLVVVVVLVGLRRAMQGGLELVEIDCISLPVLMILVVVVVLVLIWQLEGACCWGLGSYTNIVDLDVDCGFHP